MDIVIYTDVNGAWGFGRYAGAYKVATELRKAGFTVQVIDFLGTLSAAELLRTVDAFVDARTLYVGIASTLLIGGVQSSGSIARSERSRLNSVAKDAILPQSDDVVDEFFSALRRQSSRLRIVVGGAKADVGRRAGVDFWVCGEADISAVALAHALRDNAALLARPGPHGSRVLLSEDYPYNAFATSELVWEQSDYIFSGEHLPLEVARGCIFRCAFCAYQLNGKAPGEFVKAPELVRAEMLRNHERFGTTGYMISDDTYNDSTEKVRAYHGMLTSLPFSAEFSAFARLDLLRSAPEQKTLLLESGLRSVFFGIETLNHEAGKRVGKGLHPDKTKEALYELKECWGNSVIMSAGFIVGLPGETEDSVWQTVEWLMRDDCPLDGFSFAALNIRDPGLSTNGRLPMSRMAEKPREFGYDGTGAWTSKNMTRERAKEIVREIDQWTLSKGCIGEFAFSSRLRNLGFSHEECRTYTPSDQAFVAEADARHQRMRDQYVSQLFS